MVTRADAARERWARVLIGVYLLAAAVATVLWLVERVPRRHLTPPEVAFGALNVPLAPSLVSVVVLVMIAGSLLHRKALALWAVGAFQVVGGLISVRDLIRLVVRDDQAATPAVSWEMALAQQTVLVLLSVVGVVLVVWLRPSFPARPVPGSWPRSGAILASGAGVSVIATHLMLVVVRDADGDDLNVLRVALGRALGLRSGLWHPDRFDVPDWIPRVTALLLSATLVAAVWVFLRSARLRDTWTGDREVAIRRVLAAESDPASLGYFATRRDKAVTFAPDGRAAIAYRVVNSVCLAAGDPLGPRDAWPAAIRSWLEMARAYGWTPAVIGAGEEAARAYLRAGFAVLRLGDEAVVHTERFTLASTSMTPVRRAAAHARRAGLVVNIRRQRQVDDGELARLSAAADAWRDGPDRGFSMALNRFGDPADGDCVTVVARGRDGQPAALLSLVPWGRAGLSLDVMRRAPDCPAGATELMVAELMGWCQRQGVRRVSLNFAVFRGVFADAERLGAPPLRRVQSSLLGALDRIWQLERLYRANEKYHPDWVSRYVCLDQVLALPRVAVAIGRVEGFLPDLRLPGLRRPGSRRPWSRQLTGADRRLDDRQLALVGQIPLGPEPRARVTPVSAATRHRFAHLESLTAAGRPGYPIGLAAARDVDALTPPRWDDAAGPVRVAGRVRRIRRHGGVNFVDLQGRHRAVQVIVERDLVGRAAARDLARHIDIGDLLVVEGTLGASRTGTASVLAATWTLAAKALHPIPYDGLTDPEQQRRRRSTDLIVHPEKTRPLAARARIVAATRAYLAERGFTEVETPILNTVHGGASARPFRTYINAYGVDLTLRIAPELYLKRLLVAGSGPIFEIGRNFRNEGADATHNPEFTSLEAYLPFADYHDMRRLTETLIKRLAVDLYGACLLPLRGVGTGESGEADSDHVALVDVSAPWPVIPVVDAVSAAVGQPVDLTTDFEVLLGIARRHGVALRDGMGPGAVIEELYGDLVEAVTVMPTFYVDFPEETSPLCGQHRSRPGFAERWDLVVGGLELGTAYSELTDPIIQRRRLTEQSLKAAAGDLEAMQIDEEFLHALELGMPPAGGLGIGMDRLVMVLTGTQIRDVLTFPFVRPQA